MTLSLTQSRALRQMATVLYDFLPGSGHPSWKGHVSFASVSRDLGIRDFWSGGGKESAIASLLERTLERRRNSFEPLILDVVRHAITYRSKQGNPLRREEVEALNGLLLEIGFKFPDLWAEEFLDSFSGDAVERARDKARAVARVADAVSEEVSRRPILADLCARFYTLASMDDRQAAGLALEKVLNELFRLFDLEPRQPFRVVGEQIDGSFVLDFETYLVEARWTRARVHEGDLLVFRGKIEGKSAFTRGVFISINGFSDEACEAITRGKQPNFFLMEGYDLTAVFQEQIELPILLRMKLRKLTEEGIVYVSAKQLIGVK